MTLATNGKERIGAAAVFYVSIKKSTSLIFVSNPKSEHIENCRKNPNYAATIQEDGLEWSVIKGFQLKGTISLANKIHWNEYFEKYPHELSGGQLQRVVLARALIINPLFVVADEPVSMLDVSVRAGILNAFNEAKKKINFTAIYISHDLALVKYVCERTIVMYLGSIVEDGPTDEVVKNPLHPYTKALVSAVPVPHVNQSHEPLPIKGNIPDATAEYSGCKFAERCPMAKEICFNNTPLLENKNENGQKAACHFV